MKGVRCRATLVLLAAAGGFSLGMLLPTNAIIVGATCATLMLTGLQMIFSARDTQRQRSTATAIVPGHVYRSHRNLRSREVAVMGQLPADKGGANLTVDRGQPTSRREVDDERQASVANSNETPNETLADQ
jgi:hypothetical protein